MDKDINNNNIIFNGIDDNINQRLIENKGHLSDVKKKSFGFDLNRTVIDVEQNGYGISYGDDILHTYGIDTCCGLVLFDENVRILFHLDGTITPTEVLEITDKINLSKNTIAIVIPGTASEMKGTFDYKQIEDIYMRKGYQVIEQRTPATFGFVTLEPDKVVVGTGLDRKYDLVLPIPRKKIQEQTHGSDREELKQMIDLKEELLNENTNNIIKS